MAVRDADPDAAFEEAQAVEKLAGLDLVDEAVLVIHRFAAHIFYGVVDEVVAGQDEGFYLADVSEVLFGQAEIFQGRDGAAYENLGALLLRVEDDVADLAVAAHFEAAGVELQEQDGLAVGVLVAGGFEFGGLGGDLAEEIRWRVLGKGEGRGQEDKMGECRAGSGGRWQ